MNNNNNNNDNDDDNNNNNDSNIVIIENTINNEDDNDDDIENCPICLDIINNYNNIMTNCGHKYCLTCIISLLIHKERKIEQDNLLKCPICIQRIKYIILNPQLIHDCIEKYITKKDDREEDNNNKERNKYLMFHVKFSIAIITISLTASIITVSRSTMDYKDFVFFGIISGLLVILFICLYLTYKTKNTH